MKWWFCLVPGLRSYLKRCERNMQAIIKLEREDKTKAQDKHDVLLKELQRERACVDAYANNDVWLFHTLDTYKAVYIDRSDHEWLDDCQRLVGGKLARETIKAREVVV
jgi:hypothetical protein